jgi:MFS family permease
MPFVSAAMIENFGWRNGFLVYGLFTLLVVVPVVLRFVVSRPEDLGLHPDGANSTLFADQDTSADEARRPPRLSMYQVGRQPNFWIIALSFALIFCCMSATLTHMVPRLTDMGHLLSVASLVMSLCAGMGVFGKLSFGWLADKLTIARVMLLVIIFQFSGQLTMYLTETLWLFALGAALFGYGVGGVVPLHGAVVGKTFGRERFGAVLGLMRPAMFPIQILGVPFAGWVYDTTGSYATAFEVLLCLYVLAGVAIVFYKAPVLPQVETRYEPAR